MIKKIWDNNIEIQQECHNIIASARCQYYYYIQIGVDRLRILLDMLLNDIANTDINLSDEGMTMLVNILEEMIQALACGDFILVADLIELKLLPILLDIQEIIRANYDVMFFDETWEHNIEKLRNIDLRLASFVEEEKDKWIKNELQDYWLEPTNSGLYTMATGDSVGKYYFHGNVNPQRDSILLAQSFFNPSCRCYIVYGLGLGYLPWALNKIHDGADIEIYESDIKIILQAMLANNLDWIWDNDEVRLVYDPEFKQFINAIHDIMEIKDDSDKVMVMHYESIRSIKQEEIRQKMEQLFVRDNGIRRESSYMRINFIHNILRCDKSVDALKDLFKGKKAIIVAAGPSLDKNIKLLLDKPKNTIIVSTGTVYKKLIDCGIVVDFVIISDAEKAITQQFDGVWEEKVPLLVLSTAYYKCAEKYSGSKYIIFQEGYKDAEIEAEKRGVSVFKTGGSVSTIALDVCIRFGCAEICFIGLDLAYTDGYSHAQNTSGERTKNIDNLKAVSGYILSDKGILEKEVYSNRLFDLYRRWIEQRITEDDVSMPVYDATEGGSVIEGMEIISLKEYMR